MALIHPVILPTGETGDYWRMVEVNSHAERGSFATLQLYKSKVLRQADAQPLSLSYQFLFTPAEIEAVDVDENMPQGWRDVWYHAHYQLIKALAISAQEKEDIDRTANERAALIFYGAAND